jgi:hypothetical protein
MNGSRSQLFRGQTESRKRHFFGNDCVEKKMLPIPHKPKLV